MLRLECVAQNYDWGRVGEESEVGRLYAISSGKKLKHDVPYAELWMGTHPSGPSLVFEDDHGEPKLLNDWLQTHQEALGKNVLTQWDGELPFLFKVLSIAKALSIQAHPDKKLAEHLHQKHPNIYKDPNHKPEMALALTKFEALCGFVVPEELKEVLETVPELTAVLGKNEVEKLLEIGASKVTGEAAVDSLREAFTTIMTLEKEIVTDSLQKLVTRLKKQKQVFAFDYFQTIANVSMQNFDEVRELAPKEKLALVLETQYPQDVGVLASFFLNYFQLAPGEAVYLAANVPHAYLSGECIECMAASDNVVRAGLTPKFRDTQTLCSMLTYEQGPPDILRGYRVSPYVKRYSPPFEEFEVDLIEIPTGESLDFSAILGPSIFLVFDGRGSIAYSGGITSIVQRGDLFFLPAGNEFKLSSQAEVDVKAANGGVNSVPYLSGAPLSAKPNLKVYRAGVSSKIL